MTKKAIFIGRFAPPHKGHIEAIMKLLEEFDEVYIGLGSCYESGSPRHPFLAIHREKMLLSSLAMAGCDLNRIKIRHIPDFETFEDWINHVLVLIEMEGITHFVTGNKEDILDVMEKKGIKLNLEFINPELTSSITWHASDLRKAIKEGDYQKFLEIAAPGTIALMGSINGFEGIREAIENEGPKFYGGRQTVDAVVTLSEKVHGRSDNIYYNDYVLCGVRPSDKKDFPGYLGLPGDEIKTYESPVDAAIRVLVEKAGLDVELLDNRYEPAPIRLTLSDRKIITTLGFLKLCSSSSVSLAGTFGGSSQSYVVNLYGKLAEFSGILGDTSWLRDLRFIRIEDAIKEGLAYEQTQMVEAASRGLKH